MEKITTLTTAAQIPAWIEGFTQELEAALRQPLQAQAERLLQLEEQVRQLNKNLEMLLEVQLTQIETLQEALAKRKNKS